MAEFASELHTPRATAFFDHPQGGTGQVVRGALAAQSRRQVVPPLKPKNAGGPICPPVQFECLVFDTTSTKRRCPRTQHVERFAFNLPSPGVLPSPPVAGQRPHLGGFPALACSGRTPC